MERIIEAYPYDADAYAIFCMIYGKQRRWEEAEAMGQKALLIAPYHEQALNNLAVAAFLQGKKNDVSRYLSQLEVGYRLGYERKSRGNA